ncbi:MAG: hypothetical protein JWM76_5145 [Pseudonocardiales bacterium]|nr:hypothetical protein [Pseudonocardiales bacterium]
MPGRAGHTCGVPDRVPLSALLSWAWVAHTIEIDNAFEAVSADRVGRCVRISLAMWTNGLRHIDEDGVTVDQLRAHARAACNIGGLERWGWISVGDTGGGRRAGYGSHRGVTGETVLRPTRAGRYARRAWPKVVHGVQARWRTRFGDRVVDALLEALLLEGPGEARALPWSPPEVNPSDGFQSHTIDGPKGGEQERPLVALLGQALTRLTVEHERDAEVSLPLSANVLRVVGSGAVRVRDLPGLSGISKEAAAMAVAYLNRGGLASITSERVLSLKPDGLDALDGYRQRCTQSEDAALRAALEDLLGQGSALSAGLLPPQACWRAENPYLTQTRRLLANPTAALPWQPFVLHRAGWPDGS